VCTTVTVYFQQLSPYFVNLLWSPGIDSQPGGPVRHLLVVPACQATKAGGMDSWESILGSLDVYKCGLCLHPRGRTCGTHMGAQNLYRDQKCATNVFVAAATTSLLPDLEA
jgi:hypothetical protein